MGGGGKGAGEEPNRTTARKLGPLYIIQYSLFHSIGNKNAIQQYFIIVMNETLIEYKMRRKNTNRPANTKNEHKSVAKTDV
jgi:hypothetical protein